MSDEKQTLGRQFRAARMAFESVLFEREAAGLKKESLVSGLLAAGGVWLFHAALLLNWSLQRGSFLPRAEAEAFAGVRAFMEALLAQGPAALLRPDLSGLVWDPPLYYLAWVPVLQLPLSPAAAIAAVNSLFLLVIAATVFLAVRRTRGNAAGLLGAAFALALPFVQEAARRPSPDIALLAAVTALYACYSCSDEFQPTPWNFWLGAVLSLGFFTHRFFWLFALPLGPYLLSGLSGAAMRDDLIKTLVPGIFLNLPWYFFAAAALLAGLLPFRGEPVGLLHYLGAGLFSAGLPLAAAGLGSLAWLYFASFQPFPRRGMMAALPLAVWLLLTFVLRSGREFLMGPALLLPLALSAGVMVPHQLRKTLLWFTLALSAAAQSGLVPPLYARGLQLCGLPAPQAQAVRLPELLKALSDAAPEGGLVGIYGENDLLSARGLQLAADGRRLKVSFSAEPACPSCSAALVSRKPPRGAPPSKGAGVFSRVKAQPWFDGLFEKKASFTLADGSAADLYARRPAAAMPFAEGPYKLQNLSFGGLISEEATLRISGYSQSTGEYFKGELFAPSASLGGGDIYGLGLEFSGLSLGVSPSGPVLAGARNARIVSAKITETALESFISGAFPALSEVSVDLDGSLSVSAVASGRPVSASFLLSMPSPGVLELRPAALSLGAVTVPSAVLPLFAFRRDLNSNPYALAMSGLKIKSRMLEFY